MQGLSWPPVPSLPRSTSIIVLSRVPTKRLCPCLPVAYSLVGKSELQQMSIRLMWDSNSGLMGKWGEAVGDGFFEEETFPMSPEHWVGVIPGSRKKKCVPFRLLKGSVMCSPGGNTCVHVLFCVVSGTTPASYDCPFKQWSRGFRDL